MRLKYGQRCVGNRYSFFTICVLANIPWYGSSKSQNLFGLLYQAPPGLYRDQHMRRRSRDEHSGNFLVGSGPRTGEGGHLGTRVVRLPCPAGGSRLFFRSGVCDVHGRLIYGISPLNSRFRSWNLSDYSAELFWEESVGSVHQMPTFAWQTRSDGARLYIYMYLLCTLAVSRYFFVPLPYETVIIIIILFIFFYYYIIIFIINETTCQNDIGFADEYL